MALLDRFVCFFEPGAGFLDVTGFAELFGGEAALAMAGPRSDSFVGNGIETVAIQRRVICGGSSTDRKTVQVFDELRGGIN